MFSSQRGDRDIGCVYARSASTLLEESKVSRERWLRGEQEGQEPFDWYGLARAHGVTIEQAQALYREAIRQAGKGQGSRRSARDIYLELLAQARPETRRPAPGKVTRTMRLAAERAGKRRRKTPAAPGKRTLTSYLEPPPASSRHASQEQQRLETTAGPSPASAGSGATSPARERLVPGTAAYRRYQANLLAAHGHLEELDALEAEESASAESEASSTGSGVELDTTRPLPTSPWTDMARSFGQRSAGGNDHFWFRQNPARPAAAGMVFRKEDDPRGSTHLREPSGIDDALRFVTGQPLPEMLRRQMEHLLGADLSGVRVQTSDRAATAASAAGAKAFTVGPNVFFARGLYQPESAAGRELLLHELVHVVQWLQGKVPAIWDMRIAERSDPLEREAEETVRQLSGSLGQAVERTVEAAAPRTSMGMDTGQGALGGWSDLAPGRRALAPATASGLLLREEAGDAPSPARIPEGGEPVGEVGIINWDGAPQVRLRSAPDTQGDTIIGHLPFSSHVQVIARFPGGWYFVSTPGGQMGYVAETYVWTHLPEPNARLHRVEAGRPGFAISIAERYYGVRADDWGQDLRFYVNVLAWVNHIPVPDTTDGWRDVAFQPGHLIWIPSIEFARSLQGVVNAGSVSYNIADSLGMADFAERMGELWEDIRRAIELSGQHMGEAVRRHAEQALWNALVALGIMLVAAVALLAVSTAVGAAIGALAGGVGAAPGAAAGFEVGMALLEWLGLGMLVYWIGDALLRVGGAFGQFLGTVWGAHGDQRTLDRAAREFAEAIGTLLGVILEGVILLGASHGLGKALGMLRGTRFGQIIGESVLGRWLGERVTNFREGKTPIPRPREALLRIYRNVEIVDSSGKPVGEFDGIDMGRRMFIEDKSAQGLSRLNPRTGRPSQTPEQWAQRQIFGKTVTRIRNLLHDATTTRPAGGTTSAPTLAEIQGFRRLHFRIDANTPTLRAAVTAELAKLRAQHPGWEFTAEFGVHITIPPVPTPDSNDE